ADVRDGGPRGDVPVDAPHVVARLVRADLRELGAAAQVVSAELARQEPADPAGDGQVERAEQRLRGRTRTGLRRGARPVQRGEGHADRSARTTSVVARRGSGTAARIRSRIMSAVTSSARAVKLGTIRWRRTSRASSVTSEGMTYRRPRMTAS